MHLWVAWPARPPVRSGTGEISELQFTSTYEVEVLFPLLSLLFKKVGLF